MGGGRSQMTVEEEDDPCLASKREDDLALKGPEYGDYVGSL